MALRNMIRKEVQRALSMGGPLQDLPTRVDYLPASLVDDFDPATQAQSGEAAPKSVDVVFVEFQLQQVDGVNIFPEDKQALVSHLNLMKEQIPNPVTDDKLVESGGEVWKVVNVQTDTAEACFILHVRKP